MNTPLHDLIARMFSAVEAKDLDTTMSLFADDALVIDPHFPAHRMRGKAAIADGFRGAMSAMRSFGYTPLNYFETENGNCAAVETATHHVIGQGRELNFSQVFVFRGRKHANHENAGVRALRTARDDGRISVLGASQKPFREKRFSATHGVFPP